MRTLFQINPGLDRTAYQKRYSQHGRVQVCNVLTLESARELRNLIANGTAWSMSIFGDDGARSYRHDLLQTDAGRERVGQASASAHQLSATGQYAFRFAHYPIVDALNGRWEPGGPHEILLEHLNADEFIDLAREVTSLPSLIKADAQATLYAPNHYLGRHEDSHVQLGWKVGYVLNLAPDDWHPDWGGYLLFLDEHGDVIEGFRPRFNALNLFAVPQTHLVSYVPPFAPVGRYAITGWLIEE